MQPRTEGRSAREALAIVMSDNRRWLELRDLWENMTQAQQVELVATAQEMVGPDAA